MSDGSEHEETGDADSEGGKLPPALRADPDAKTYIYRDFANLPENASDSSPQVKRGNSEVSIRVQKFPVKLYAILSQTEFSDIITWLPHGRSWKVLKPNLFETLVMPLFFEYSNYHSFNRLVNAWSFRRISSGPDRGSYYHELFLRGKPHLQKYMRRLPKTHKKLTMKKENEPDFYKMDKESPLPPLEEVPIGMLAMRRQAMAQAAAINRSAPIGYGGAAASMNPSLSNAASRLPSYAGYPSSLVARSTDRFGVLEQHQSAAAHLGALDLPASSLGPMGSASLPSASASLPPSAAASLPSSASSLQDARSSFGRMPMPQPPHSPLDLSNPASAQNYQYQRMRHLQHLQLFQRQMGRGQGGGAPPTAEEEELLRLQQGYGQGGFGRGGRPPYM